MGKFIFCHADHSSGFEPIFRDVLQAFYRFFMYSSNGWKTIAEIISKRRLENSITHGFIPALPVFFIWIQCPDLYDLITGRYYCSLPAFNGCGGSLVFPFRTNKCKNSNRTWFINYRSCPFNHLSKPAKQRISSGSRKSSRDRGNGKCLRKYDIDQKTQFKVQHMVLDRDAGICRHNFFFPRSQICYYFRSVHMDLKTGPDADLFRCLCFLHGFWPL